MNNKITLIGIASAAVLLTGCVNQGPRASFKENFKDNFALTSASDVPASQVKCVTLIKPFTFTSGSVTYNLPAGRYKGTRQNSDGTFYYSPTQIKDSRSSWLIVPPEGIFLSKQFSHGNLFAANPEGLFDRPIRGVILPSSIFSYIKKNGNC